MNHQTSEAPQVQRGVKNTVFLDLFSLPEYRLQMFQTLHPEMTDVTADDIVPLTLTPVILNSQYNDLAFLVRDKLIIFVEAQSTWSVNILVRMLLYLATTYHEYIINHEMNVYSSHKLAVPEPEFYVIYTGSHKIDKEIISLREDFWHNPNAKLDMQVKVICAENKSDVIGQYIIFCRVIDEQIKLYGRTKKAAEEAIRICQDAEVLRAYLDGRKKEVISIMMLLFDQDFAMKMYLKEVEKLSEERGERRGKKRGEKRGAIAATVEMCQEFGASIDDTIHKLSTKFGLSKDEASEYVNKFWKS